MIREILVVEDRNQERDTYELIAKQYGVTFTAANLVEALAFLGQHTPSIVISDLHLHDRNSPLDVASHIYNAVDLHRTRLYFMTTDLGDTKLVEEIRQHFPSIKIIEKSHSNLERLFADFRHNERGMLVESMDMGTKSSHESIRKIVHDILAEAPDVLVRLIHKVIDEALADIGLTRFEAKRRMQAIFKCETRREKLLWAVGLVVAGALAMTIYGFTETAFIEAFRKGVQP